MADSKQGDSDTKVKRRRWPYVASWLVVLVVLYLVIFRLPEPRLTLDYLKALIWPGLVAVVLYWLREPLRQKAAELLNLKGPGFEANFATQRLQDEVTGPAATVLTDMQDSESESPEAGPPASGISDETKESAMTAADGGNLTVTEQAKVEMVEGEQEHDSRFESNLGQAEQQRLAWKAALKIKRSREEEAIEEIMRVSAWWGYDMAKLGFKTRPTPVVEWTEDGRPLIQYAKGEPRQSVNIPIQRKGTTPDLKVMASRLENEIRVLEATVESPMTIQDYAHVVNAEAKKNGERARLRKLKLQLRTIDPDSPLGIE